MLKPFGKVGCISQETTGPPFAFGMEVESDAPLVNV